jgi:hypothetical protein
MRPFGLAPLLSSSVPKYLQYPFAIIKGGIGRIQSQKKERTLRIPFAIPMIMKIPINEPVIRRTVPSTLPFLRKKLTMLAERIPKPRMGRADSRINPPSPRETTLFKMGLSSRWARK